MHSALWIPELRGKIVEYLVDNYTEWAYSHYQGDLNALTRTCKAFSEPCLNELWRCQNGIANLVMTMPADLWGYLDEEDDPQYQVELIREPCPADWDRASYYAEKIKYLEVASFFGIDGEALAALHESSPTHPFLPRLTCGKVEFYRGNVQSLLEPLTLLLTPKITRFIGNFIYPSLDPRTARLQIYLFLYSLFVTCKHLHCLNLEYMGDLEFFPLLYATSIVQHVQLKTVSLGSHQLNPEILNHLEQLPTLTSLTLDGSGGDDISSLFSAYALSKPRRGFRSLKSLEINAWTWIDALTLVKRIKCPLSSLRIAAYDRDFDQPHPHTHPIQKLLHEVTNYPSLSSFELIERTFDGRDLRPASVSLEPLSSLQKIRNLTVQLPHVRLNEDSWLERLPLSFPNLESLWLGWAAPRVSRDHCPSMTLQDLLPIATQCRQLQRLGVSVKCDPFDFQSKVSGDISKSPIHSVSLFGSPVGEPDEVLPCLMALFPNAKTIEGDLDIENYPNQLQYKARWEDLNERLPNSDRGSCD